MIEQLRELPEHERARAAIIALAVACAILSVNYEYRQFIIFRQTLSPIPNLISGIAAVFLILPIVRGDFLYTRKLDRLTVVSLFMVFYVTAGFTKIGLGIPGFLSAPGLLFAIVIIALANYRPKKYGELAVVTCAVFGGMNLLLANSAMGFWGFLLALSSFVGILLLVDLRKVWGELSSVPQKEDGG